MRIELKETSSRLLLALIPLWVGQSLPAQAEGNTPLTRTADSSITNPNDWLHFNPYRYQPAIRLVPSPSATERQANIYSSFPSFPHDPSQANIVYGRGKKSLPTEIYAKAFDVLNIGGKFYQAPAAGESKHILVNGESITLLGTTVYTPLRDNRFVGNPANLSPFDPTRVFYKDKSMWPAVIYAEAGKEIVIANQRVTVPAAGQFKYLTVTKDGHVKVADEKAGQSTKGPHDEGTAHSGKATSGDAKNSGSPSGSSSSTGSVSSAKNGTGSENEAGGAKTPPAATDKTAADKAAADKAAADKAAADKAAADKAAADKVAADKAAADKAAADKAATDKATADKAAADKAAADKAAADKAAADKAAADKAAADKAAADKAAADKAAADKAAADKAAADKAAADKAAADKDAADKAAADKAAADKAAAEAVAAANAQAAAEQKAIAEKLATEKSPKETAAPEASASTSSPATASVSSSGGSGSASNQSSETPAKNLGGAGDSTTPPEVAFLTPSTTTSQPSNNVEEQPAALPKFNIAGDWGTQNTTTSNTFQVRIEYNGTLITATIVNQGSGYIPVGQVRFKGDYKSNPFEVTVQRAYPGYTNPYWEPGTLTVSDPDNITVKARTGNLVLKRIAAPPPPPPPPPPSSGTQSHSTPTETTPKPTDSTGTKPTADPKEPDPSEGTSSEPKSKDLCERQ